MMKINRRALTVWVRIITLLPLMNPLAAHSAGGFQETFENVPPGNLSMFPVSPTSQQLLNNGFDYANSSNQWYDNATTVVTGEYSMQIVASPGFGRMGKVLMKVYNEGFLRTCLQGGADCTKTDASGNWLLDRHNGQLSREINTGATVWGRGYFLFSKIDNNDPITPADYHSFKIHYLNYAGVTSADSLMGMFQTGMKPSIGNQSNVIHTCPNGSNDVTCVISGSLSVGYDRWYCIEYMFGPTTNALYVDSQLSVSWSNQIQAPPGWVNFNEIKQAGWNLRFYIDDIAIDSARLGCGSSPSDSTPPTAPNGLKLL